MTGISKSEKEYQENLMEQWVTFWLMENVDFLKGNSAVATQEKFYLDVFRSASVAFKTVNKEIQKECNHDKE